MAEIWEDSGVINEDQREDQGGTIPDSDAVREIIRAELREFLNRSLEAREPIEITFGDGLAQIGLTGDTGLGNATVVEQRCVNGEVIERTYVIVE